MRILILFILSVGLQAVAQVDNQERYSSDSRQYYVWSEESKSYILRETEFEHSLIDIREIGSRSNGYIAISLTDNGRTRLFHGSITAYSVNEAGEPTWQMRSKKMKGKITYNVKENTMTYVYDANETRYQRILVFTLKIEDQAATE